MKPNGAGFDGGRPTTTPSSWLMKHSLLATILAAAMTPALAGAQLPIYVTQWGSPGTGAGQFRAVAGVALDASSNVYVVDSNNGRIQRFTNAGAFLSQWGTPGSGSGQFNVPQGIAVDANGN